MIAKPLISYDTLFLFVSLLFALIALTWIIVGVRAWLKRHSRKNVLRAPDRAVTPKPNLWITSGGKS